MIESTADFRRNDKPGLVLDIDNTLVSAKMVKVCEESFRIRVNKYMFYVQIRPFLSEFLENISRYYEIFFFTSSKKLYAKKIIQLISPNTPEDHCFYRDSCKATNNGYVKDLSVIKKPLEKLLLLDDSPLSGVDFPNNFVPVPFWDGEAEDDFLSLIQPILIQCASTQNIPESFNKSVKLN